MIKKYDLYRSVIDQDIAIVSKNINEYIYFSLLSDMEDKEHILYVDDFNLVFSTDAYLYNEVLQNQILMTPINTFATTQEPQIRFPKESRVARVDTFID